MGFVNEGAVVAADVRRRAILVERELAYNLFLDVRVGVCRDDLCKWSAVCTTIRNQDANLQREHCFSTFEYTPVDSTSCTFS